MDIVTHGATGALLGYALKRQAREPVVAVVMAGALSPDHSGGRWCRD